MVDDYDRFIVDFRSSTHIDLSLYKRTQMERRLRALRDRYGHETFAAYLADVLDNPERLRELIDRVTINVSEFYRNSARWDYVQEVAPQLWHRRRQSTRPRPLRCWSAACSTGEEPYTLALVLHNVIPLEDISILATDIDERALSRAREGRYSSDAIAAVPIAVRDRFFHKDQDGGTAQISAQIRRSVDFRRHDLLQDPYGDDYDLIVCRNVLIYFTEDAKDGVFQKFSRALAPGGLLFVGSTEYIPYPDRFRLATKSPFFYQKTE